ncbi:MULTISPECIES: hypothetical protein [Streptacidiphilus]|uniref:Nucleotidyltransferase family protein n=1 Tax=Streptacidiphilus cavernicola TaxID=3342716 RepID=A0ABV6URP6_9ACTN|nr:hypothetical protein [Streptacidiphilus jeojiense]
MGSRGALDVSVDSLRDLLGSADPASPTTRDALLRTARGDGHKLAATLLSLWAAEGQDLSTAEQAELSACRERIGRYRRVWDELRLLAPELFLLKGMTVAALYPPGVLRSAGDLDVVCQSHRDFWRSARHLTDSDWELEAFTVGPAEPGAGVPYHLFAEFRRPGTGPDGEPDPEAEPYAVGLVTAEIVTDIRRPAKQLARPVRSAPAASAVALVAERWERPFRSRDLLDLSLLLADPDPADLAQVHADLDRIGLWPEWREAVRAIRQLGRPVPAAFPGTRSGAARERLLRGARALRRWANPVRVLAFAAQAGVEDRAGRFADAASDLVQRQVGGRRLLAAGVPLFGVPLDGPPVPEPRLDDIGRHLVARTPIGSFLLVAGAARQEWLDELEKKGS